MTFLGDCSSGVVFTGHLCFTECQHFITFTASNIPAPGYTAFCVPIHQLDFRVVSTFSFVSTAALNSTHIVWMYAFRALAHTPKAGVAGSCGNTMFNVLRNATLFPKTFGPFYTPLANT